MTPIPPLTARGDEEHQTPLVVSAAHLFKGAAAPGRAITRVETSHHARDSIRIDTTLHRIANPDIANPDFSTSPGGDWGPNRRSIC